MRLTNQQKWDNTKAQLDEIKTSVLNTIFKDKPKPTIIYKATPLTIEEIPISNIKLYSRNEPYYYGKPTKNDIEKLINWIKDFDESKYEVHFDYTINEKFGKVSGAYSYSSINNSKNISLDRNDLIEIQKELNVLYAPKEGYKECAYCRKQTPIENMVKYKIIFQSSKPCVGSRTGYKKFVDEKENLYCSKECGIHDQMAHEG